MKNKNPQNEKPKISKMLNQSRPALYYKKSLNFELYLSAHSSIAIANDYWKPPSK
jgi:hypothetical protein